MLSKIIKESYIQLDKEVDSFKEAIEMSMEPLLQDEAITNNYIENIISILEETGPYIVITKHIALPHAPSNSGAMKLAISFTRLKNEVVSGNEPNDPVKYLFGLSTTSGTEHLEVLSELVTLLGDDDFLEFIQKVKEPKEFINFLNKFEGNGKND